MTPVHHFHRLINKINQASQITSSIERPVLVDSPDYQHSILGFVVPTNSVISNASLSSYFFPGSHWLALSLGRPVHRASGGIVEAGPAYQKNLTEEVTKLQRLYGGGDFTKFPEFKFSGQLVCYWSQVLRLATM